jgi:hypothetical protein
MNYSLTFTDPVDGPMSLTIPAENDQQAINSIGDAIGQWMDDGGLEGVNSIAWMLTNESGKLVKAGTQDLTILK